MRPQVWYLMEVAYNSCTVCAVSNNGVTKNFQVLLYHTLAAVSACEKHEAKATAAANAVYLARMLFQHFSESLNAVQLAVFSTDTQYPATDITPGTSWYGWNALAFASVLKPSIHKLSAFDLPLLRWSTIFMINCFLVSAFAPLVHHLHDQLLLGEVVIVACSAATPLLQQLVQTLVQVIVRFPTRCVVHHYIEHPHRSSQEVQQSIACQRVSMLQSC